MATEHCTLDVLIETQNEVRGKVITVNGVVDPGDVGVTLMHEHLLVDLSCNFAEPKTATGIGLRNAPVTIDILGRLRRNAVGITIDNMRLTDVALAVHEALEFVGEGGRTVVDVTNIGLARDPCALRQISNKTGLNIVMGSGLYVEMSHPQWAAEATIEDLRDLFIRDVLVGVDGTGICSGIIGEIGTSGIVKTASGSGLLGERSGHITAQEEKVLRAAAQAARFAGVAVTVHLHPTTKGAFRILEVLADEGLSPDRIVIGHVDWIEDYAYHKAIAETGVWVEFDSLGRERYVPGFGWSGTDEWRVDHLARLCEEGFDGQLVVSQDCCLKMDLRKYGGMGYGHILQNIIPMMQERGIAKHRVDKLLIDNPRRILTVLPGEFE